MNTETLVSVIIPTYKGSCSIGNAIESVVNQTYKNLELIVVDDNGVGSEEQVLTQSIVSRYEKKINLQYIAHERNSNGAVARNTGLKKANGNIIAFLDDDDWYFNERIEKCVKYMKESKQHFDAVYTGVAFVINGYFTRLMKPELEGALQKEILLNYSLIGTGSNLFVSRQAIMELGGFDETFIRHQDVEFLIRFFEKYQIGCINEVLVTKGTNGVDNTPPYDGLIQMKEKIFSQFSEQINRLASKKQEYFWGEYRSIYFSALQTKNKNTIKQAKMQMCKYGKYGWRESVRTALEKFKIAMPNMYKWILLRYCSILEKKLKKTSVSELEYYMVKRKI